MEPVKKQSRKTSKKVTIFIDHEEIPHQQKWLEGERYRYVMGTYGGAMGPLQEFEVPCDQFVDVEPEVAEILKPYWDRDYRQELLYKTPPQL